jgi:HemY protein
MMRLIIFILTILALATGANWLFQQQGEITATWQGYEIHTSTAVAILTLGLGILAFMLIIHAALWLFSLPETFKHGRKEHRMDNALKALTQGFAALGAGDEKSARIASQSATKLLAHHPEGKQLAQILSAETEQLAGNMKKSSEHFTALLKEKPTQLLALKGLLVNAQRQHDLKKARELAEKAYDVKPDAPGVLRALLSLYKLTNDWNASETLLKKEEKRQRWSFSDSIQDVDLALEHAIALTMQARALHTTDSKAALLKAEAAHKAKPSFTPALELYLTLLTASAPEKAQKLCEKHWKSSPSVVLMQCWLSATTALPSKKRIKLAEKLIEHHSAHPLNNLLMGNLYLALNDTVAARNHALLALDEGESAERYTLMANVEDAQAVSDTATTEKWRQKAERSAPESTHTCRACNANHSQWQPTCPSCNAVDVRVF